MALLRLFIGDNIRSIGPLVCCLADKERGSVPSPYLLHATTPQDETIRSLWLGVFSLLVLLRILSIEPLTQIIRAEPSAVEAC